MSRRREKKEKFSEMNIKYANEIAQLEADGIQIKNKRLLGRLLERADGQVDVVKQLLNERKEKHEQRKEYQRKHRNKSPSTTAEGNDQISSMWKKRREISPDDIDNLKRLRLAGVQGPPIRILTIFHECNESIDLTLARTEAERERRTRAQDERLMVRIRIIIVQQAE